MSAQQKMEIPAWLRLFITAFAINPLLSACYIILIIISSVSVAIEISYLGHVVNAVVNEEHLLVIVNMVKYLLFALLLPRIIGTLSSFISRYLYHYADRSLSKDILLKSSKIRIPILEDPKSYNLITKTLRYSAQGIISIMTQIISLLSGIISIVSIVIVTGNISFLLISLSLLISLPVSKQTRLLNKEKVLYERKVEEKRRWHNTVKDMLTNRKFAAELWSYDNRVPVKEIWRKANKAIHISEQNFYKDQLRVQSFLSVYRSAGFLFTYIILIILLTKNYITPALGVSSYYAFGRYVSIIDNLFRVINNVSNESILYSEYAEVMSYEEEGDTHDVVSDRVDVSYRLKDVYYQYPRGIKPALHGINLTINPREKIVLVGNNGAGKSTLVRILLGFDTVTSGEILVNDKPLQDNLAILRANSSAMFQDYAKYNLSLRDNIIISDTDKQTDSELLNNVIKWAELDDIIKNVSNGLEAQIFMEKGFSGGQWQRIALARAKFRKRTLVILDEPNAAADALYEEQLYSKFLEIAGDCTTIIVSHRLPICQLADRIIVMDEGRVVESGTHKELFHLENGYYRRMFESQAKLYMQEN